MNSREAAYLALLHSLRHEKYISDYLNAWKEKESPSQRDFELAYEIAAGSARMALSLDDIARNLAKPQKLSLKLKERALLRTAIYQRTFMSRVPLYAIVDETIKIAKKHCHLYFANFLNPLLRKLDQKIPELPQDDNCKSLSIRYSFPEYFIELLLHDHSLETMKQILTASNQAPILMAKKRSDGKVAPVEKAHFSSIISSSEFYIQNATPVFLIKELSQGITKPQRILDLCASPGGKLLAVHDLFQGVELFANDVSEEKLVRLQENLEKYQFEATLSLGLGEHFQAKNLFDLIILDVPCSNSGVLNKRPEARWRLTKENVEALAQTQIKLLQHAKTLLAPEGQIWYLTCSILSEENERHVTSFAKKENFQVIKQKLVLPNSEGWDGGFACSLRRF